MPTYTAEYDHYGPECEHHIAGDEQQVRRYFELERPWLLPVVITEVPSDEDTQE